MKKDKKKRKIFFTTLILSIVWIFFVVFFLPYIAKITIGTILTENSIFDYMIVMVSVVPVIVAWTVFFAWIKLTKKNNY